MLWIQPHKHNRQLAAEIFVDLIGSRQAEMFEDPMYLIKLADNTFKYPVPEKTLDYQAGYPHLAAALDCDPNFSVYRKNGWLHNHVLSHLQAELQVIEEHIRRIDKIQSERGQENTLCYDHIEVPAKKKLLAEAKAKLAKYDGLLFRLQKENAMKKPTRDSKNSVINFVAPSLIGSDTKWICRTNDLVVLEDKAK